MNDSGTATDGLQHGRRSTYERFKCRCVDCRAANRRHQLRQDQSRAERLASDPTLAPHGSASTYKNWRCRCDACVEVNARKCAEHHAKVRAVQEPERAARRRVRREAAAARREGEQAAKVRRAAERELKTQERLSDPDHLLVCREALSLNTPRFDEGGDLACVLPDRHRDTDPLNQIYLGPSSIADLQFLIHDLPIIPGDWLRRLRDGEFKLVLDADSVAFVVHPTIPDAVPWRDAPGPPPRLTLSSPGRMAHRAHSRKAKAGHRPARKSKVAA